MPIGGASVGPWSSPAKFSFDINAAPDCTKDFVVFPTANPVSAAVAGTRASIVAFNNLYTGPGPSGICPSPSAPAATPSVLFAYDTGTAPGSALSMANLSPVLSLDGTKVAFVENTTGSFPSYTAFHVLTWKAGEGTLSAPVLPGDCSPGNSCMTTLVLSTSSSDQYSSPFIDYAHDTAYVGDGSFLHKITPVFRGTPQDVTGNGWPVSLPRAGSPVYDSVSGHIFVSGAPGFGPTSLLVIESGSGATISTTSLGFFPNVADPIVDSTNQTVFVFFTAYPTFDLTVEQFDTSGTLLRQTAVGQIGGDVNIFMGDFDNNYYNNPATGTLYFSGAVNYVASLYGVGFTGTTMNASAVGPLVLSPDPNTSVPGPLTEIYNPNFVGSPDRLFVGLDSDCVGIGGDMPGCIENFNITSGFPSAILNKFTLTGTTGSLDVSGMVVDNISSAAEASSIYFDASGVAIKLTQSALQ